jgi:hypothetical protein
MESNHKSALRKEPDKIWESLTYSIVIKISSRGTFLNGIRCLLRRFVKHTATLRSICGTVGWLIKGHATDCWRSRCTARWGPPCINSFNRACGHKCSCKSGQSRSPKVVVPEHLPIRGCSPGRSSKPTTATTSLLSRKSRVILERCCATLDFPHAWRKRTLKSEVNTALN